ncbi:DsrJ [Burkholderiales bacterium]|nr:DsrJ [Burkholderiales bacterium]
MMSMRTPASRQGRGLAWRLLALTFALPATMLAASAGADETGRTPKPTIVIESREHCVAPPEQMRREHPDMLRHQRDRTVHRGERGMKVSLNACIGCHADRHTGSVIGSEHAFCQGCHSYAAVHIDCFDCHQSTVRPSAPGLALGASP